ncbi:MAG: tagaturonate epimerase family protein [Treponema sp.]|jgi:hypothetical protein|nr:tagaturonate epimerase family protein [Treponema sp.]
MQYAGFDAYEKSIQQAGTSIVFMAYEGEQDIIVVAPGKGAEYAANPGFTGTEQREGTITAPLNHNNAEILRKLFPFTAPVRGLRKNRTFGVGDRLGIATPGHIRVFEKNDVFPIFAQQSIRELNLTGRTYEDVLDAVSFAVFREGFTKGFGADGDHLKTIKDVEYALSLGFTMITLDCSDHIKNNVTEENALPLSPTYRDAYVGKAFDIGEGITLSFTEGELRQCAAIYGEALEFAVDMYRRFLADGTYNADFEISIDETASITTPLQHFFVARELTKAGVSFATIAPRFCGEFQKGIDYIGDIAQFEQEIHVHAIIARHFGYKLSIHSGSDKFSVFPAIGVETQGVFHIKTAGTNWLEAMRVVAQADPALYREVHRYALVAFDEASKYYHVTTDLSKIPNVDSLSPEELPALFENNDSRQLIHITYGLILGKRNPDGSYTFRDRLYTLWRTHYEEYSKALEKHIGKHVALLGV